MTTASCHYIWGDCFAAAAVDADPDGLVCTFLAVAVRDERWLALHVGDGAMFQLFETTTDYDVSLFSAPENGRYANETFFLGTGVTAEHVRCYRGRWPLRRPPSPSADARMAARAAPSAGYAGFVLTSDGADRALFDYAAGEPSDGLRQIGRWFVLPAAEQQTLLDRAVRGVLAPNCLDDVSIATISGGR